ncbi:hypothetical protein P3102_07315 [Amycolatopsis sp. QT-25]|uniref:hypothetical protein n=1 Tax=Amycolatopsis sp. QT-25 TaxID=3034022 RepID=UPI0023EBCE7C|nr:hypothetical protein [Amycolatopsis sp. QT-25]WET81033.1 hypothetical protein P3102_07315 [Amycolatopsis sp. QT-25]
METLADFGGLVWIAGVVVEVSGVAAKVGNAEAVAWWRQHSTKAAFSQPERAADDARALGASRTGSGPVGGRLIQGERAEEVIAKISRGMILAAAETR